MKTSITRFEQQQQHVFVGLILLNEMREGHASCVDG